MTPGARLQAAVDLLAGIEAGPQPADIVSDAFFRARRYAGAKDRRAIAAQVFAVLRHRARLDWWLARAGGGEPSPRRRLLAALVLVDGMTTAAVASLAGGRGHDLTPLSPEEERLLDALAGPRHRPGSRHVLRQAQDEGVEARQSPHPELVEGCEGPPQVHAETLSGHGIDHPDMPATVRLECPDWLQPSLERAWGAAWIDELTALNAPAPVDLRVNTLKTDRARAITALARDGIDARPTPLSPIGLRLPGRTGLGATRAWRDGLVEVQDEGSQLAALLVDARPGMAVADLCAGGGGKTLALAAAMAWDKRPGGRLVAGDVSAGRLEGLRKRLRRLGLKGIEVHPTALADDAWIAANRQAFDRVLIDVPCSGSGTWRRNPDARWRLSPADIARYRALQRSILATSAALVKPGGRSVYVTCSVLREENEDRVAAFLADASDFAPVAIDALWRRFSDAPIPGPFLRLSPATTGTDGFFVAVLQRHG